MADSFDRSIRAQEQMVEGLLADLGIETVSFVGHDLGGGVGLRYASHEPDAADELVLSNAVAYDSWPVEPITDFGVPSNVEEMGVDELRETLAAMFRETLVADDPDEEFVDAMASQWASERGTTSLSRNAVATNTNHTTELDYGAVDADALLLWGADDEFQPISYADRLADDVGGEVRGLDGATHWVMQDRPEAYREELASFLLD
jgi:pimeloyl-ACP methyl ester carboxylesterase